MKYSESLNVFDDNHSISDNIVLPIKHYTVHHDNINPGQLLGKIHAIM